MNEFFAAIPWSEGSAISVFVTLGFLFLKGYLLPKSWVDTMLAVRDKSATEFHAAYLAEAETNRLQARQIEELLEIARRDAKLLESMEATLRGFPNANR